MTKKSEFFRDVFRKTMIKNYFKIALRVIWKNKVYVTINLLGLGFALACCILAYVNYDYRYSFDKNFKHTENIYRLNSNRIIDGSSQPWGITPVAVGEYMAKNSSEDVRIPRVFSDNMVIKTKQDVFSERVHYADKNLFNFFPLPLKHGNYSQFDNKNTIIISEAIAKKYFGNDNAAGRELTMLKNGREDIFTVAGILQKIPSNSSFQVDIITSFNNGFASEDQDATDWRSKRLVTTFAEIKNKDRANQIASQLTPYADIYNAADTEWKINFFFSAF